MWVIKCYIEAINSKYNEMLLLHNCLAIFQSKS